MKPPEDITVTLACDNSCLFCPRSTLEHVRVREPEELLPRLEAIRARSRRVVLTGGEVTVLPGAVKLVSLCRRLGFTDIALITNGRRLSDRDLASRLVQAGLTEICVTIYDLRPAVHDAMTRTPGSLEETLAGLGNVLEIATRVPLSVRVNTLMSRINADGVHATLNRLSARGVRGFLVADVVLSDAFPDPLPHARVREIASAISSDPDIDVPVVFRGFPLCLFRDVALEAEPQDIDTTIVDGRSLDAYFSEFFSNFVHVDSCGACSESSRCPGLQKRYLDALGCTEIESVDTGLEPGIIDRDLEGFEPWPDPGRLAVTPTTACQFRCRYCQVALGRRHADPEVLDRSVDLLLTSSRTRLELQFFGGEPLLRRAEVMRTMDRGRNLARRKRKQLHFTITTNGLLLDAPIVSFLEGHDASVLFSLDGPLEVMAADRPPRRKGALPYQTIERNLETLVHSRVPHFVNMVITPERARHLASHMLTLADLGVETVQICYALGPSWTPEARRAFCDSLRACARLQGDLLSSGRRFRIQNFGSHAEPVILSTDLLVDVDGMLYSDAALFAEKALPRLRGPYRIGSVFDLASFDGLRRSRASNLLVLRTTYPPGDPTRITVEEHLEMGREVQRTLDSIGDPLSTPARSDENPLLDSVIRRSVADQARLMAAHPEILKLPLLLLENSCAYDCIFCKSKPLEPTPLAEASRWLEGNDEARLARLGLVGNEPLLYPQILAIVEKAREHGFTRFDALTTGQPLADRAIAEMLVERGVTSFSIPLWAVDASVHDAITRTPWSHAATLEAIDHLKSLGATIHVHANLLAQNLDRIRALETFVARKLGLPFCIIPVRPKHANLPYADLAPRYADLARHKPLRSLVAFPLCVVSRVQDPAVPDASLISDVLKIYVLDQPFVKPEKCAPCTLRNKCAGTFRDYLDLYGDEELEPVL